MLSGPLQSVIFDQSGVGEPFKMSVEEIRAFFDDNDLDFERLVGPDYEESLDTGGSLCVGCN